MADPLSVTASIIAVAGLAKATAKGIDKIISKRHAPTLLLQLANEVHMLQIRHMIRNLLSIYLFLCRKTAISPLIHVILRYQS